VVAPERVNLGLNTFLERSGAASQANNSQSAIVRNLTHSLVFNKIRLAWQTLNYEWDTRVLSFDGEAQESFLAGIGVSHRGPISLIVEASVIALGLLGAYLLWMQTRARAGTNKVKVLYERFCLKTARLGAPRHPSEGPRDYARRAAQLLPNESTAIRRISENYIAIRYSPKPSHLLFQSFAKDVRAFAKAG